MKGVDLAFVELATTRLALRRAGVVPFVLADAAPADGEAIAFAGYPSLQPASLAACHLLRRVPWLLEDPFHWYGAEANDCQGIAEGASGSPVFSLATGQVVAVVNTKAEGGTSTCTLNQPCEAGSGALDFEEGTNYAISVVGLRSCFDDQGVLELSADGCPLDRGTQMQPQKMNLIITAAPGQPVAVNVALTPQGLTHYRYAAGPAATTDCRAPELYGAVQAYADAPQIQATVPGDPGFDLLCVQAGVGPDPTGPGWQRADRATPRGGPPPPSR
jgi:hypothetical protein